MKTATFIYNLVCTIVFAFIFFQLYVVFGWTLWALLFFAVGAFGGYILANFLTERL